jgi:hypothetical protein
MTTSFPTALDAFLRPNASDSLQYLGDIQRRNSIDSLMDAVEAVQATVGVVPADTGTAESLVTAATVGSPAIYQTTLTLALKAATIGNTTGVSFGGVKLFTFPAGRILVHGVTADIDALGLADAGNATPIVGTMGGDFAIGTTAPTDGTLSLTDEDLLPETSWDPFSGTVKAALAASAQFDGTTTPVPVYANLLIDDADVGNGASDILTFSGTVVVTWTNLGDY